MHFLPVLDLLSSGRKCTCIEEKDTFQQQLSSIVNSVTFVQKNKIDI